MKLLCLLLLVALAASEIVHDGDIFDMFDIPAILKIEEERNAVLDCIMERKPCGKYQLMKDRGYNIMDTRCGDCTPKQKAIFEESIKEFERDFNDDYKKLIAKFFTIPEEYNKH